MGLGITVGILADLLENDPEGAAWIEAQIQEINATLADAGFDLHREPRTCHVWWADGHGYSGLHALREVAGLVWQDLPVPRGEILTGQDFPNEDRLFQAALPALTGDQKRGYFRRLLRKKEVSQIPPFIHLVGHSDAEGYYVPIDFPVPLSPKIMKQDTASIWPLGSVQALTRELDVLTKVLEIPTDLHSDSDAVLKAVEALQPREGGPLWMAQPIATYSALILREACAESAKTGAAISFN